MGPPSKPVDSAEINLGAAAPEDTPKSKTWCSCSTFMIAIVVCALIMINLVALYIIHFTDKPSGRAELTFSKFEEMPSVSPTTGDAVSFNSMSVLRNGAGTTGYLDATTFSSDYEYSYMNMAPLGISQTSYSRGLVTYCRTKNSKTECVVTTMALNNADKSVDPEESIPDSNIVSDGVIRGVVTLSDDTAVILIVDSTYTVYVAPVDIDGATVTLKLGEKVTVAVGSVANFISKVDTNVFAVAYYEYYDPSPYGQRIVAGKVASGSISLGDSETFGPENGGENGQTTFSRPFVLPDNNKLVAVAYYTSKGSGLCITTSTYSQTKNEFSTFAEGTCNENVSPDMYLGVLPLSTEAVAVSYHDKMKNHALTTSVIELSSTDDSVRFRASYVDSDVRGEIEFGLGQYPFNTMPSLRMLSGNRIAVSFFNPSMNGKPCTRLLKYSPSTMAFKTLTPVLPIGSETFSLTIAKSDDSPAGTVTLDSLNVADDSVMVGYIGKRGKNAYNGMALVENYGKPMGVLADYESGNDAKVVIRGDVKDVSTVETAGFYYATTKGGLVARSGDSTPGSECYFDVSKTMVMTADSAIGYSSEAGTITVAAATAEYA